MNIPPGMPRLKGFRFPREIIAYVVGAYHRFAMSTADVEDLLAERGLIVSREAIRLWVGIAKLLTVAFEVMAGSEGTGRALGETEKTG